MFVLILSGHYGAGKSTIARQLTQKFNIKHLDIVNSEGGGSFEFHRFLYWKTITNILAGHSVLIEFAGMNPDSDKFINTIQDIWVPVHVLELIREPKKQVINDVKLRNNPHVLEEVETLRQFWGTRWIAQAKEIRYEILSEALAQIEKEILNGNQKLELAE